MNDKWSARLAPKEDRIVRQRHRVVAALLGVGLAVAMASAASAASSPTPAGFPSAVKINLHNAMERALPHVRHHRIAGIVRPVGKRVKLAPRIGAACTEPNCPVTYHSGSVQHSPHVYMLLWGPNWTNTDPAYGVMWNMLHGLGVTSHDTWSTITSQYGDGTGNPAFGASVFAGAFQDSSTPPNPVTFADLAAEADGFATTEKITDLTDAQVVISTQSGTCYSSEFGGYVGSCGTDNPNAAYCAYHTYSNEPFTVLPYQLDAGVDCGENFVNPGSAGTYDATSLSEGHEYAETISDPFPNTGWIDLADTSSGGEIGDKCVNDAANLTLSTGTFAMQQLWSNSAGGCVMASERVTVTNPGSESSVIGTAVSLQLHASSSSGAALSFKGSGLPAGLSVSASGLVSGTPGVTAGTYRPKVTATDANGVSASVTFTWAVRSGTGLVKGYASKCADDLRGATANGNRIVINPCTFAGVRMTFLANGELTVLGKCLRDSAARVILYTCNGATTEQWTRHSNGEYVIRYNGTCLQTPSATNGAQLTLARCNDNTRQRWSLP